MWPFKKVPVFCVNCKWYLHDSRCTHPSVVTYNLVTGHSNSRFADMQRETKGKCGPRGKLFKQKKMTPVDMVKLAQEKPYEI